LSWKGKFDAEMDEKKKLKKEVVTEDSTKLSGRQLFERDTKLVNSDMVKEEEDGEDAVYTKEESKEKEKLFCYDNELFEGGEDDEISFEPDDY